MNVVRATHEEMQLILTPPPEKQSLEEIWEGLQSDLLKQRFFGEGYRLKTIRNNSTTTSMLGMMGAIHTGHFKQ